MIILCKRNVIIPSNDGQVKKFIPKDFIGKIDSWVAKTHYFKDLVKDGKIVVTKDTKERAIDEAVSMPVVDNAQKEQVEDAAEEPTEEKKKK